MSSHRYQRVDAHEDDLDEGDLHPGASAPIPSSPPPSFHSRSPSPPSRNLFSSQDPLHSEADQTLADTFGNDDDGSDSEDEVDDRQRLMRGNHTEGNHSNGHSRQGSGGDGGDGDRSSGPQRTVTTIPAFNAPTSTSQRVVANDGVFANLAAKPVRGEKTEDDRPPTYEQAAADATPPYWETTIVAPGMSSDEVYVDGLPVGSVFSFIWNGMISTSFQLVGFLLTYLLHTTHAAKNGSRAGLGLTLVQYGFYMKGGSEPDARPSEPDSSYTPSDPNSHDFNPDTAGQGGSFDSGNDAQSSGLFSNITTNEWISYILMIVGWFILIRAVSDFLRARRHEQLILQSPERGLPVPIIAEGERSETVV